MNNDIQDNLVKLLDAYLEDLKTEADTVTHIVNYINESTAARAALAEQLEAYFWTREKKVAAVKSMAEPNIQRTPSEIQGKADALLKGLAEFNIQQPENGRGM